MKTIISRVAGTSLSLLTVSALMLGAFGMSFLQTVPVAYAGTSVVTGAATSITATDAMLNGVNQSADAPDSSFWVSTTTFSTSPTSPLPAGVFSTPSLGAVAADAAFSSPLSAVSGILPITAGTTYYFAAWTDVGGTWSPGAVQSFTTAAAAPVAATGVSLNESSNTLTVGGVADQLTATILPASATNQTVTYTSGAPSVATVSAAGLVTAVAAGTATITVTSNDTTNGTLTATDVITVISPSVTTSAATAITSSDATLNGTNGSADATGHSFWVSTGTCSTASTALPVGVFSTPDLGAIASSTTFSASLSSISGILPVTAGTTYYFAAWTNVGGTWYPGAVRSFTTLGVVVSPVPTVSRVASATGTVSGGDMVTLTGTGFTGATAGLFGATPATDVTVINNTSLTAVSPAGTGTVDVTVTTPGGVTATSSADQFTYQLVGVVAGPPGSLAVTSIDSVTTNATADGTFAHGWKYVFHITVPTNETNLSMKFADWFDALASSTIAAANNIRISSAQADNADATVWVTAANTFTSPSLHITGDLDAATPGDQIEVTVETAVPVGTVNGSYATSYGVQTLP